MPYSLLSRFQGVLWGTALAQNAINHLQLENSPVRRQAIDPVLRSDCPLPEAIVAALIQHGQSGIDIVSKELRSRRDSKRVSPLERELEPWIAVVPIVLFFHEDDAKLRHNIGKLATALQLPSTFIDRASVVAYAIACALQGILDPATLIPQTRDYLQSIKTESVLGEQLATVQTLLDRGASLEHTRIVFTRQQSAHSEHLTDEQIAIALAFYCFLSTPEDFRLSLLRSRQLQPYTQLITVITAAFSGAYNTQIGIPIEWRMATDDQIQQLAVRFYAAWSGVYDASQITSAWGLPAVAAPKK
jgi:ADP-ribosylglycohydrolase